MTDERVYHKNSHCSFCGAGFSPGIAWPRSCPACGNRSYMNPLPVAVVLLPVGKGLVVIRRNIEPMRGELALPGGYLDLGESWQEGGKREVREETGIEIDSARIRLYDVMNGMDGTLVIFGLARRIPGSSVQPFRSLETQEVLVIEEPRELCFTMHTEVVARYFAQRERRRRPPGSS